MIGTFKQKNAGNALFLLVYALFLKFSMFLHPVMPVLHKDDNYLYQLIFKVLDSFFHGSPVFFSILSFIIIFSQFQIFGKLVVWILLMSVTLTQLLLYKAVIRYHIQIIMELIRSGAEK